MSFKSAVPRPIKNLLKEVRDGTKRSFGKLRRRWNRPNVYDYSAQERIGMVFNAPSEMSLPERLFLYSLVRGTRPMRVLEIGSRHGGSASIMAAAMEDIPSHAGRIIGVDPGPQILVPDKLFYGRFTLIKKPSPDALPEAAAAAAEGKGGGKFDLIVIDGLHIYDQVRKDLAGVLPHAVDGAYILCHDAFHFGVVEAIRESLATTPALRDCGYPCSKPYLSNTLLAYGGFRMLRVGEAPVADAQSIIEREAKSRGLNVPSQDRDLVNHDGYWHCPKVKPCAYCVKHGLSK